MKTIIPYLMFNGQAEEAFTFYQAVFGGKMEITRFSDMAEDPSNPMSEADKKLVANVSLELRGPEQMIMASDVPSFMPPATPGDNFFITLETDTAEEADKLYEALKDGEPEMEMQETEWAEKYAMFKDKFGMQWMINYIGNKTM
jgi:PhnB protein